MSCFVHALILAPVALAALVLAACDRRDERREALEPEGELTRVDSTDAGVIQAPNGSMSLAVREDGGPTLVLSAGFLRRSSVAKLVLPAEASWSPDSRRFFVNERAGLRLWTLDGGGAAVESVVVREAAALALLRLNECAPPASEAVETRGTAWGDDGRVVFVTVRGVPGAGGCAFANARELSVAAEVETGRLERAADVTAP